MVQNSMCCTYWILRWLEEVGKSSPPKSSGHFVHTILRCRRWTSAVAGIGVNPEWGTVSSIFAECGLLRMRADKQIKGRKGSRRNIEQRSRYRRTKFQVEGRGQVASRAKRRPTTSGVKTAVDASSRRQSSRDFDLDCDLDHIPRKP